MKKLFSEIPTIREGGTELRKIEPEDAGDLKKLVDCSEVYRYLPTFLFEQKYEDINEVISRLYDECLEESLIWGVFSEGKFCGLLELYGYHPSLKSLSVGCRLLPEFWGKGIASKALNLVLKHLFYETDVKVVTASVLKENAASSRLLRQVGFRCVLHSIPENWGYPLPLPTDKWIKTARGYNREYRFNT